MKNFGFQWHLTDHCNLRCRHCYQERSRDIGTSDFSALVQMADRLFFGLKDRAITVNITGGEPLISPHLLPLIDYLGQYPNLSKIQIISNGTHVEKNMVDSLSSNPKFDQLKISLEAPVASVNDEIRGPGNFDLVRGNLTYLVDALAKPIVLMTTLSRKNIDHIPETVQFAVDMGLSGIVFERFVPLGRGTEMALETVGPDLWTQALRALAKAAQFDTPVEDLLAYKAFWLTLEGGCVSEVKGALCNLGDESMALMPQGTVYPCRRLQQEVGNLLRDDIQIILERLSAFRSSNIKQRLRGKTCSSCQVEHCAGCRALALAVLGDVLGDDPTCPRNHPGQVKR